MALDDTLKILGLTPDQRKKVLRGMRATACGQFQAKAAPMAAEVSPFLKRVYRGALEDERTRRGLTPARIPPVDGYQLLRDLAASTEQVPVSRERHAVLQQLEDTYGRKSQYAAREFDQALAAMGVAGFERRTALKT